MPRSRTSYRASYRATARNKALRADEGMEWLGVPTKRVHAVKWSETYQANGERERARRANKLASYPNPLMAEA